MFSKPFAKPTRVAFSRVRMCPEEIPDGPQQETGLEEDNMESIDASDAVENERPNQFGEEANQEEESQTEHEKDLLLVEDEFHSVEEIEEQAMSTGPVNCWKKPLWPWKKHCQRTN